MTPISTQLLIMKGSSLTNGHGGQLRTVFLILTTSVLTVLFTFLGLSAYNVNLPQIAIQQSSRDGLTYKAVNKQSPYRLLQIDESNDVTYDTNDIMYDVKDDDSVLRDMATHSPQDTCIKRLPQAIIAGVQKCGTTALLKFLSAHPQVKACLKPAETKYFSQYHTKSLDWYKELMPCSYSNEITMEKSPPYFYRGYCANRIRKMDPKTKIIFIVKDPVVRTESMYAMLRTDKGKSFAASVTSNNLSQINENTQLIDFSNYPKYMGSWVKAFDQQQILVVDGHNLEAEPAVELGIVEQFLGIGSYFTPDKFMFNETKRKFCLYTDHSGVQCLSERKGRKHPEYSNTVRTLLEDHFRPQNEAFFKMINRRFDWGY